MGCIVWSVKKYIQIQVPRFVDRLSPVREFRDSYRQQNNALNDMLPLLVIKKRDILRDRI